MKYFLNKRNILALLTAATVFTSCKKDFLDINDNPNQPTDINTPAELIFTGGVVESAARQASGNFRPIAEWVGYLSAPGDFAIVQDETTYNIDNTFGNAIWANNYNTLFDLVLAKQKSLANGDTVLAGCAMVLSAKLWQETVDVFGAIPYFQAFKNDETNRPAYTPAKDIYDDLQKVLDSAKTYMSKTPKLNFNKYAGQILEIGKSADQKYGGLSTVAAGATKLANWIKFANTLKLRMLIHQSEVAGFNPAPEIAKISSGGVLNILREGQTAEVNPGYKNDNGKQSPFYANYGLTPAGADANTSTRANAYIVKIMAANLDARRTRIFAPVSGNVVGTTFGLATGNPAGAASSKFGPGMVGDATQDQWLLTSFESLFLEAEAMARGWVTGNARTAYENAVRESFVWLGVPSAITAANTYLTDNASANYANSGATALSKAKFIAFQKYIAMTGVDPMEAWTDIRRLDMLTDKSYISVNPGRLQNKIPNRLLYPQTEYTTNAANVGLQGAIDQYTSKIFWQP